MKVLPGFSVVSGGLEGCSGFDCSDEGADDRVRMVSVLVGLV